MFEVFGLSDILKFGAINILKNPSERVKLAKNFWF